MADTGWKFPGTMVGNRTIAGSDADWVTPDNAKADDGSNATVLTIFSGNTSSGLAASNFDFSSIPAGATIDGIEARVGDYKAASGTPEWVVVRLILADNSDGTANKFASLLAPFGSLRTDEVGGAADLWSEALSRSDVQDLDFGFFIGDNQTTSTGALLEVDFMQMRVFYHVGLPTRIFAQAGNEGHHPPFKSSGGAFYAVFKSGANTIDCKKTSDPTADSWAIQDDANNPVGGSRVLSTVQSGDLIHVIAWFSSLNSIKYNQFDMSDDTWAVKDETIETPTNAPTFPWCSIAVRSDGDVVIVYSGDTDQVMGGKKERVDANVRSGSPPTWGGPIALDAAGDIHYGNPNCVLGTSDAVHIIWQQQSAANPDPPVTWGQNEARTLDSADSLSTTVTKGAGDAGTSLLGGQNVVSYDNAGTQRIVFVLVDGNSDVVSTHAAHEISGDISWDGADGEITVDAFTNGEVGICTIAELNEVVNVLYSGGGAAGVDQDLYLTTSSDHGDTLTAAVEELGAITVNFISANIYVRGADTVMAYVYDDGGVQKYNEKVLIAGAGLLPQTQSVLQAVSRMGHY